MELREQQGALTPVLAHIAGVVVVAVTAAVVVVAVVVAVPLVALLGLLLVVVSQGQPVEATVPLVALEVATVSLVMVALGAVLVHTVVVVAAAADLFWSGGEVKHEKSID